MEKVFFKERTVYISQDFMLKMVRVKIDISKRCQEAKNGLFLEVAAHFSLCDEAGIKRFYMHSLRHTYATRAIERGVQPKVLQQLSGHASIKTTMDRYVHVTDESLVNAIRQFQQATPPVKQKGRKKGVQEI